MAEDLVNPHGHTASEARAESRLIVRCVVRDGLARQMLNDGRSYGTGSHEIQVYKSDLPALMSLVETREAEYQAIKASLPEAVAEWCANTRKSAPECPISAESRFRQIVMRDVRPLVSAEVVRELGTIEMEHETKRARAQMEVAREANAVNGELLAKMVDVLDRLENRISRIEGGNNGNQNRNK